MVARNNTRRLKIFPNNKDVLVNEEDIYDSLCWIKFGVRPQMAISVWVPVFAVAYRGHLVRLYRRSLDFLDINHVCQTTVL